MEKVNLASKLQGITEEWTPKIVGELNGQYVKLVKAEGEFIWHRHEHEDELFYVVDGRLDIHIRGNSVHLSPGEFVIIPKGIEHKPCAPEGAQLLIFEPVSTLNTGNVRDERTVDNLESI